MQFLRRVNLNRINLKRFNFFSNVKDSSPMPLMNGGTLCIPRLIIINYFNDRHAEGQKVKAAGIKLIPEVQAFKDAIINDPVLKMCFQGALDSLEHGKILYGIDIDGVFDMINPICIKAPKFYDEHITGVPFYALFIDFLNTRYGQAFFANPIANDHLKQIFNAYKTMLKSKVSLGHLNEVAPHGWFSQKARKYVNWDDYYVDKTKPNWGFQNWNSWFTRAVRPEARPIDKAADVIVNSSDSYPLVYPTGSIGRNPATEVQADNKFWLKDNKYSLYDMFGVNKNQGVKDIVDEHFVGGTVYQAFLDPWCYHRWHSPVSGTIEKSYKLGGTYYLSNPGHDLEKSGNYIDSQAMLSIVSVRQIYIIKLDNSERRVAVIEIGMVEVSSCNSTVIEDEHVNKGDQLGYFEFGGSSHVIIFDKDFDLTFEKGIFDANSDGKTKKQLVNSKLCSFK